MSGPTPRQRICPTWWGGDAANGTNIDGWCASSDQCGDRLQLSSNLAYLSAIRGGILYAEETPTCRR
jgi:hypothetical protein